MEGAWSSAHDTSPESGRQIRFTAVVRLIQNVPTYCCGQKILLDFNATTAEEGRNWGRFVWSVPVSLFFDMERERVALG